MHGGDGTVPLGSALPLWERDSYRSYLCSDRHGSLHWNKEVQNFIWQLLVQTQISSWGAFRGIESNEQISTEIPVALSLDIPDEWPSDVDSFAHITAIPTIPVASNPRDSDYDVPIQMKVSRLSGNDQNLTLISQEILSLRIGGEKITVPILIRSPGLYVLSLESHGGWKRAANPVQEIFQVSDPIS
jgi:hypothetical protein